MKVIRCNVAQVIDMKMFVCVVIFCLACAFMSGAVLKVALDGTQAFTSIQSAIDASVHGDTVLVYPGRYLENIRFFGKNITLASLELTTGDADYKYQTIIDGNHVNSVIQIRNGESNVTIRGFSIVNGNGFYDENYGTTHGGGFLVGALSGNRRLNLINCVVADNYASSGGGMQIDQCYLTLSGVTIRNNKSSIGGGMFFAGSYTQYTSTFDPVNRCNIYSNYAANGSDLYYYMVNSVHVIVDTFTVVNPWNFYATAIPSNPNISNPFTFDILNTVHEEINQDLYVAPWGNDDNTGQSPDDPMQSLFTAMYRIASDSENPKTVHVANGHYSPSLNGQFFPVPVKSFIKLLGESRDCTILDAENTGSLIFVPVKSQDFQIQDLCLVQGVSGIISQYAQDFQITSTQVSNMASVQTSQAISIYGSRGNIKLYSLVLSGIEGQYVNGINAGSISGSLIIRDVEISSCSATERLMAVEIATRDESDILIDVCNIHNNINNSPDVSNTLFQISPYGDYATRLLIEIRNSAFYDNHQAMSAHMGMARSLNDTLFIENCTFAGNTGGSSVVAPQGTSVLTNNIFWNPALSREVFIPNYISSGIHSNTTLGYNNIRGGTNGVYNATSANPLIWGEGNTSFDPLFTIQGNNPYTLSADSPLIDSGWLNDSGLAEPGLDAGGNERLLDGDGDGLAVIDKGAYEYQPLYAPVNLSAVVSGANVWLDWQMPILTSSLSGYRIYRNAETLATIYNADVMSYRDHITESDTLTYEVVALYGEVESASSNSVTVITEVVGVDDEVNAPGLDYFLAYPNPFKEFAVLRIGSKEDCEIELEIFNVKGQKVKTIKDKGRSGRESVLVWNADDGGGERVAPGIYLCRVSIDGESVLTRKLIYTR